MKRSFWFSLSLFLALLFVSGVVMAQENTKFVSSVDRNFDVAPLVEQIHASPVDEIDDVVGFWNFVTGNDSVVVGDTCLPIKLVIYSDSSRVTNHWVFYCGGDWASYNVSCYLSDSHGVPLTPNRSFSQIAQGTARVDFFTPPVALVLEPVVANSIYLNVITTGLSVGSIGNFAFFPDSITMRPSPQYRWPGGAVNGSQLTVVPARPVNNRMVASIFQPTLDRNVIAGSIGLELFTLTFQNFGPLNWNINRLRFRQSGDSVSSRAIDAVNAIWSDDQGAHVVSQPLINGYVNFNTTARAIPVGAFSSAIVTVSVNLRNITTSAFDAKTGDLCQLEFVASEGFEATSNSGVTIRSTSDSTNLYSGFMRIRKTIPVIEIVDLPQNQLVNGVNEVYRFMVTASLGSAVGLVRIPFDLQIMDGLPTTSPLQLSHLQLFEGLTEIDTAQYDIIDENGLSLRRTGVLIADTARVVRHIAAVFRPNNRNIPQGMTKIWALKAEAQNVGNGIGGEDVVSVCISASDDGHQPMSVRYCEVHPDSLIHSGICLEDVPNGNGREEFAQFIWSDCSGNFGNNVHTAGTPSSYDYFNGWGLSGYNNWQTLLYDHTFMAGTTDPKLPISFSVGIYPNPFNPNTTIRFEMPNTQRVDMTIYDLAGREVAKLVRGEIFGAGTHQVHFNGTRLSSGTYIVRLKVGEIEHFERVQLVK